LIGIVELGWQGEMAQTDQHYSAVVVGSGFGGTMTALPLAQAFKTRGQGETVLMLERGTWWTTPVGTVQDKEVRAFDFLVGKGSAGAVLVSGGAFSWFLGHLHALCAA
jgi:hypothetical protein